MHAKSAIAVQLSALATAVLFSSCVTHHYGDARLSSDIDFPLITVDPFWFPPFPIDRVGHYEFTAKNFPSSKGMAWSQFPEELHLRKEHHESPPTSSDDPSWSKVEIRVAIIDSRGNTLFDEIVRPGMSRKISKRDTSLGLDYEKINKIGRPRNYRVLVTVITPSSTKGDRAFLGSYADELYW